MAEDIKSKKTTESKHGGDILVARVIVCVIILLGTLFVRFNNRYIYDSLKFWYTENILEERYSFEALRESIKNMCLPIKIRILELFPDINLANK